MIELSDNTEALARRLAAAQDLSVDEAIRQALEARAYLAAERKAVEVSANLVAARRQAIDDIVARVASLPILDPRSSQDITDDLDPL